MTRSDHRASELAQVMASMVADGHYVSTQDALEIVRVLDDWLGAPTGLSDATTGCGWSCASR